MSTIGRYEYKKSCTLLVQLFDESVQTYQSLISSGQTGIEIAVQEGISALHSSCISTSAFGQQSYWLTGSFTLSNRHRPYYI